MSLSAEIERVDGSQNDILRALAQSYGINTSGLKIDQIAAKVKASQKFKLDGLLSVATAGLFDLPADSVPDDVFQAIKTLLNNNQSQIDKSADIVTGSYVGNGQYGEDNPNSIVFKNPPIFAVVVRKDEANISDNTVMIWVQGVIGPQSLSGNRKSFSQENNTLKWWSYHDAAYQLNQSEVTYCYAAAIKKDG